MTTTKTKAQKQTATTQTKEWPEWDRKLDPELYDYYAENFLEPGWAGRLTPAQAKYIREVIQRKQPRPAGVKKTLRYWWGFRRGYGYVTEAAIREVARNGDPDNPDLNAELVRKVKGLPESFISHDSEASGPTSEDIPALEGTVTYEAFKVRWRQRDSKGRWQEAITGDRILDSLDEAAELCRKVNQGWGGDIEQWPIEVNLTTGEVVNEYRRLVGLKVSNVAA